MNDEQRVRDFRNQAASYRQTASVLEAPELRNRYIGWAADLELRADVLDDEIHKAEEGRGA